MVGDQRKAAVDIVYAVNPRRFKPEKSMARPWVERLL
jgi:hypothetical protein